MSPRRRGPFRRAARNLRKDPALAVGLRSVQGRAVALRFRRDLAGVERFVVFVGYPRSGHTLVGSLLNAHPEIVIANELDALGYVAHGVSRPALFGLLVASDRAFERSGRRWTGYDYRVSGQWQGRWERLRVLGDKEAGRSSFRLERQPWLLARTQQLVGVPLVVIHVARHPLDVVARMALEQERDVAGPAGQFLDYARVAGRPRDQVAADGWLDVRLEDLVADPAGELARLCRGLGVEATPDFLTASAAIVTPTPRRTRDQVSWPPEVVAALAEGVAGLPVLGDYPFESASSAEGGS